MKAVAAEQRVASSDHLLTADQVNANLGYLRMKRLIDIFGSIIGLILLSPIFMIKIEDPKGPVFFKQARVGKGETEFQMYKFRSMVSNA